MMTLTPEWEWNVPSGDFFWHYWSCLASEMTILGFIRDDLIFLGCFSLENYYMWGSGNLKISIKFNEKFLLTTY